MQLRNDTDRWGALSLALHWITALLVVAMAGLGLWMTSLDPSMYKLKAYALHKSLGLTVLGLTGLRIAWLLVGRRPAMLPAPRWQRLAAIGSHAGLYVLLLLVPLSGWWYNSTAGFPLRWFGLVALPPLGGADAALKAIARERHEWLFYALAALVVLHVAAALWHHLHLRDATLSRMLGRRRGPE
jgi:cytochrome b561